MWRQRALQAQADPSLAMNLEFHQALRLWRGPVLWHSEALQVDLDLVSAVHLPQAPRLGRTRLLEYGAELRTGAKLCQFREWEWEWEELPLELPFGAF